MARVVILGAGIAGHTAALHLRRRGRQRRPCRFDDYRHCGGPGGGRTIGGVIPMGRNGHHG